MTDEIYMITNGQCPKTGEWTHHVSDEHGLIIASYGCDIVIDASADSHEIAALAAAAIGTGEPDHVNHDGKHIHFGYNTKESDSAE